MLLLPLLLLVIQDPVPAAAPAAPANNPAVQAIRTAANKLSEAASYTVQQTVLDEGPDVAPPADQPPPAAGADAATPGKSSVVFTAHVQKGKPTHFQQDKMEAWREGDVLFYRTSAGTWERFGDPAANPKADPKADPDAARNMRLRMNLARTQVAHEMLAGLDKKIATANETKEGGKSVITGSFTPEGAASLGQRFSKGGTGGAGDGSKTVDTTGTFRVVVAADGNLESMTYDVVAKGTGKDGVAVDRKRHVELKVSAVGSTTMEVPADLKTKATDKPKDQPKEPPKN